MKKTLSAIFPLLFLMLVSCGGGGSDSSTGSGSSDSNLVGTWAGTLDGFYNEKGLKAGAVTVNLTLTVSDQAIDQDRPRGTIKGTFPGCSYSGTWGGVKNDNSIVFVDSSILGSVSLQGNSLVGDKVQLWLSSHHCGKFIRIDGKANLKKS